MNVVNYIVMIDTQGFQWAILIVGPTINEVNWKISRGVKNRIIISPICSSHDGDIISRMFLDAGDNVFDIAARFAIFDIDDANNWHSQSHKDE